MTDKWANPRRTGKRKAAAIALAAVAVLSVSTLTAFGASAPDSVEVTTDKHGEHSVNASTPPYDAANDVNAAVAAAAAALDGASAVVNQEGGKFRYSTDGGQTWSEHAPEGVSVDAR
ncbi:hypothetical protein MHI24_05395 [Paenibacillus sp. FSL K6-1096]|uniref:hypothetical protein n=1 Tax=Paenibacillus sp. FSL K6-1096 TaxID=2921460 RepID=UPI0030EDB960